MTRPFAPLPTVAPTAAPIVNAPHPTSPQFALSRDRLFDAVASERRLVEELIGLMRQQRAAIGAHDLQGVEQTVYAVQRVLHTLAEARKRRRTLNTRFGCAADAGLSGLEAALGASFSPRLREALEGLQGAAHTLSGEVALNRRLLREALAASDEYVRVLLASGTPQPLYTETASADGPAGARLIDRQA